MAPYLLPPNESAFGRKSKPRSHLLYISEEGRLVQLVDPDNGETLVELRRDGGHQTVFPGSVHPSGEPIEWVEDGEPAQVDPQQLVAAVKRLAAGCLLRRAGWGFKEALRLVAGKAKLGRGELGRRIGEKRARKVAEWLSADGSKRPGSGAAFSWPFDAGEQAELPASREDLEALATAIPNHDEPWNEWNAVGLGFHAASGGSEDGFVAWARWSRRSSKHDGEATTKRWAHFHRSKPERTGIQPLIARAQQADPNFRLPSWDKGKAKDTGTTGAARQQKADGRAGPEPDLGAADGDGREVVRLGASWINKTTRKCAAALRDELYLRGAFPAALVRVEDLDRGQGTEDDEAEPGVVLGGIRHARGTLIFAEPSAERLLYRLDELLAFERFDSKSRKWVRTSCPAAVGRRVIGAASEVGLRSCTAIVTVPLFINGEIVSTPGYHPGRRVFLDVPPDPPEVPKNPTKQDALRALDVLLAPLTGYISRDEGRLRCSCAAAALTAVLRPSLPHAPAVLIDAEVPGAGKGKAARALSVIATGRLPSMVTEGHAEEEVEKRMASAILTGSAAIMIDNLQRTLASSTLESGLTEGYATIRLFGKLADVTVPCAAFIVITANNATLRADMLRRTLPVRIVAGTDKPETRVFDFDPYDVAVRRRAEIVAAGLTIAKAWWLARDSEEGRRIGNTTLGSFERWADLVAGAVEWLTGMNPIELIEARKAEDPARNAEWHVVTALHEMFGEREWTAKEAAGEPAKMGHDGYLFQAASGLDPDIWASVIPLKGSRPSPLQVGQWLNKRKDRVWGNRQLVSTLDRKGIAQWRVAELPG